VRSFLTFLFRLLHLPDFVVSEDLLPPNLSSCASNPSSPRIGLRHWVHLVLAGTGSRHFMTASTSLIPCFPDATTGLASAYAFPI